MRNINARVPGLVSFLELITDGRAPDVLSGQVQAQIDLSRYVALGKTERWRFDFDVPTGVGDYRADLAPSGFTTAVPNAEAWVVTQYSVRIVAPAGRLLTFVPTIWKPAIGSTTGVQPWVVGAPVSSLQINVGGSGTNQLTSFARELPIICPPRTEFGYSILDWAGSGTGTLVVANLEFFRLRL